MILERNLADERFFRRRGLPTLIENYSATEDILTRAWPWLVVIFVLQIGRRLVTTWTLLLTFGVFVACSLLLLGIVITSNTIAHRPLLAPPKRIGWWSAAAFVIIPSAMRLTSENGVMAALRHVGFNILSCTLIIGIIGWGLIATVAWALVRVLADLAHQFFIVIRQMAAIFLFAVLLFFNQELWQFASTVDNQRFTILTAFMAVFAVLMLLSGTPRLTHAVLHECGADHLSLMQRANFTSLLAIRQSFQVALIIAITTALFVILSALVVSPSLYKVWNIAPRTLADLDGFIVITLESAYVCTFLGLLAGLNFAVVSLTSSEGRSQFMDGLEDEFRPVFSRHRTYRERVAPASSV